MKDYPGIVAYTKRVENLLVWIAAMLVVSLLTLLILTVLNVVTIRDANTVVRSTACEQAPTGHQKTTP